MNIKTKTEIITEYWESGSERNKKRLSKYRLVIEHFAYACMKELEKQHNHGKK